MLRTALCVLFASALAGCAGTGTREAIADNVDYEQVAKVERAAFSSGAKVYWRQLPVKVPATRAPG